MSPYQRMRMKVVGMATLLAILLNNAAPAVTQAQPAPQVPTRSAQNIPALNASTTRMESEAWQEPQTAASVTDSLARQAGSDPIDCSEPLPGARNRLVADNEILVGFRDGDEWLQMIK